DIIGDDLTRPATLIAARHLVGKAVIHLHVAVVSFFCISFSHISFALCKRLLCSLGRFLGLTNLCPAFAPLFALVGALIRLFAVFVDADRDVAHDKVVDPHAAFKFSDLLAASLYLEQHVVAVVLF